MRSLVLLIAGLFLSTASYAESNTWTTCTVSDDGEDFEARLHVGDGIWISGDFVVTLYDERGRRVGERSTRKSGRISNNSYMEWSSSTYEDDAVTCALDASDAIGEPPPDNNTWTSCSVYDNGERFEARLHVDDGIWISGDFVVRMYDEDGDLVETSTTHKSGHISNNSYMEWDSYTHDDDAVSCSLDASDAIAGGED